MPDDQTVEPDGLNAQLGAHASTIAGINSKIDALHKGGMPPSAPDDLIALRDLRHARDTTSTQAQELAARYEKAGAKAPKLADLVKEAAQKREAPVEPLWKKTLADIREKYPLYKDVPDENLIDGMYNKLYADKISRPDFEARIGRRDPNDATATSLRGGTKIGEDVFGLQERSGREEQEVFEERHAREKELKAQGIRPIDDPKWAALTRELGNATRNQRIRATSAGLEGEVGGVVVNKVAPIVKPLVKKAFQGVKDIFGRAIGTEARQSVAGIRDAVTKRAAGAATAEEQAAAAAGKRVSVLEQQQVKIGQAQPQIAEKRAVAALGPPKAGQTGGLERETVLDKQRAATRALEAESTQAGADVQKAKTVVETQQALVQASQAEVDQIEKELIARPKREDLEAKFQREGMSVEDARTAADKDFGVRLRQATQKIRDERAAVRRKAAGYDEAINSAGEEPRVNTSEAVREIEAESGEALSPALESVLKRIKGLLHTGEEEDGIAAVSVKRADRLKNGLDDIIDAKMFGDQRLDRVTVRVLSRIRQELSSSLEESWPAYKQAVEKWREFSPPLNPFERGGPLQEVIAPRDARSTEYAVTEAEVVGGMIKRANEGNETFSVLIGQHPELRDSARLHFTQDLFGKGKAPDAAALRTWLEKNQRTLRQLGLYDEFRSIPAAKEAAKRAVDEASGLHEMTLKQAQQADRNEKSIAKQLATQTKLRDAALKRVKDAQKARVEGRQLVKKAAGQKEPEARAKDTAARFEKRIGAAKATQEKALGSADRYHQFESDLKRVVNKKVPAETEKFIKTLRSDGKIDVKTADELLKEVQKAQASIEKTAALRKRMRDIAFAGLLAAGAGYGTYRGVRAMMGF